MASVEHTVDSLFGNTTPEPNTGCWLWTGYVNSQGYSRVSFRNKSQFAHRVMLLLMGKVVPEGHQVDHLCRVRSCINPSHLEIVTGKENNARSESITAKHQRQTHCCKGHVLTADNLRASQNGWRSCLTCHRLRRRAFVAKQREANLV